MGFVGFKPTNRTGWMGWRWEKPPVGYEGGETVLKNRVCRNKEGWAEEDGM